MAIIKTLDILLRGRTDQLGKDFKQAESQFKGFATRARSVLAAVIPVFSAGAFTAGIKSAIASLGDLEDRSFRFSIDPGELAAVEMAAKIAGVKVESLAMANKILSSQIIKSNKGLKESTQLFDKLGVSSQELQKLSFTDRLATVGKGFDKIQDQVTRTATALKLFGKSGIEAIPLITNGAVDLKNAFAELKSIGGIFTAKELATVGKADDAIAMFSTTVGNVFKRIAIQLSPSLTDLFRDLTAAIKPGTALNGVLRSMGDNAKVVDSVFQVGAFLIRTIS